MKLSELDLDKLGGSKKKEFKLNKYFLKNDIHESFSVEEAKEDFIKSVNEKGYVPFNVRCIKSGTSFNWKCGASCSYFGKKKAPQIGEIENLEGDELKCTKKDL